MVYFEDLGSTLDVSLDEMDSFLDSEEHSVIHSDDVRNFEVVENVGQTVVVTFERKFDGKWGRSKTRITSFAPYCRFIEELDGEFAGSRFVGVHRPAGARVHIDVFGDIQSKSLNPDKVQSYWLGVLAKTHSEDEAALRKFRTRK